MGVMSARKKYKVEYPLLYAPESNKEADKFNSVQRAHQNTLVESYPGVMIQMLVTGLFYPLAAASFGALWAIGRLIYFKGYSTGGPQGRMIGGLVSHLGDFPLMILCLKVAYDLLM